MVSIPACHAGDLGSIPSRGDICADGVVVNIDPFQGLVPGSIPGQRKYFI